MERLLESVRNGTAPFLPKEGNHTEDGDGTIRLKPMPAARSAITGRAFKGLNQLVAQTELAAAGAKDSLLLTFEQAQEAGAAIRRGSSSITLTSYGKDASGIPRSKVYHLFPSSCATASGKLKAAIEETARRTRRRTDIPVECHDPAVEKYLGAYLAASVAGATLTTDKSTADRFKERLVLELSGLVRAGRHADAFQTGARANEQCRDTLRQMARPPAATRDRAKTRSMAMGRDGMSR